MHFIYIDDSTDRPLNVFSAICVPCSNWNSIFQEIKEWRLALKEIHGIPLKFELHATEFLSGRGSLGNQNHLTRHTRAQIFHSTFKFLEDLSRKHNLSLFNVANDQDNQYRAFENLLNRINRTMQANNSYCHLICDEGKERQYTNMVRRMRVHNPIPSRYGTWPDGRRTRNITLDRILEDPQFKSSEKSYFIQLADFVAFALLRSERPTPKVRKHGIHRTFDVLDHSLIKVCSPNDPRGKGIIR